MKIIPSKRLVESCCCLYNAVMVMIYIYMLYCYEIHQLIAVSLLYPITKDIFFFFHPDNKDKKSKIISIYDLTFAVL